MEDKAYSYAIMAAYVVVVSSAYILLKF